MQRKKEQKKYYFAGIIFAFLAFAVLLVPTCAVASGLQKNANTLGLVGYWSFNDGAGTLATDFSGNGSAATLVNGPVWVGGKYGKAVSLDGADDYAKSSDASFITSTNQAHSVFAWVNPSTNSSNQVIWNYGEFNDVDNASALQINSSGHLQYGANGRSFSSFNVDSGLTVPANQWSFVGFSHDASLGVTFYVNGQTASGSVNGGPVNPNPHLIGAGALNAVVGGYFSGKIDEVRVYNRELSSGDAAALYAVGATRLNSSQNTRGPQNGLIGQWSFDGADVSGTTAYDRSGSGNNGTLTGGSVVAIGKIGQALSFDGVDDYVSVANGGGLNNLGTGSISMWVKWSGTQDAGAGSTYGPVTSRQSNGVFSNQILALDGSSPATAHIIWMPYGFSIALTGATPVGNGRWRHVVITYTSGSHTLYLDGVVDGTGSTAGAPQNDSSVPLSIGAWSGDGGGYSTSLIDDVRVYNRILSASEVSQLYNLGGAKLNSSQNTRGPQSGLVGLWSFNGQDIVGTTAYDRSGQGNNGTITNNPAVDIGKIGQALKFDGTGWWNAGTGEYITIPNTASLNTATVTYSLWVKAQVNPKWQAFISKRINDGDEFVIMTSQDGYHDDVFKCGSWGADEYGARTTTTVASKLGQWVHLACSVDGVNGTTRMYLNGIHEGTGGSLFDGANNNAAILIGKRTDGFDGNFVNGSIDDVRIYNRVLTDAEVLQLYNLGK